MKNKRKGIEAIKRRYGIAFVAPWVFGVIVFVAVPIITTVLYSLSIVTVGSSGPEMKFVGFSNYYRLLFKNTVYVDRLAASLSSVFTSLPIIVSLSLILAIILNQNFKGRMIMALDILFAGNNLIGRCNVCFKRRGRQQRGYHIVGTGRRCVGGSICHADRFFGAAFKA